MVIVRSESTEDLAEIQIVKDAATATLRQTYRPKQRAIENKARISAGLQRLVAVAGDWVVGTVQYYLEGQSVRVIGLGVHADYRRKGVARCLIRHLEKIGSGHKATQLKLYTVKETGNVELFRCLGFTIVTEREDEFFESDKFEKLTEVEMVKELSIGEGSQ